MIPNDTQITASDNDQKTYIIIVESLGVKLSLV